MKRIFLLSLLFIGCQNTSSDKLLPKDVHILDLIPASTIDSWAIEIDSLFDKSLGYFDSLKDFASEAYEFAEVGEIEKYKQQFPNVTWQRLLDYTHALIIEGIDYEIVEKEFPQITAFLDRIPFW